MSIRSSTQSALDDPIEPPGASHHGDTPLDLRGLLAILRWRWRLICAVTLGTIALAGLALAVLPPKYAATTIILIDPRQPHVTTSEAVLSGIGSDAAAVESQVDLIQSSALAQKVIAKLQLDHDPEFTASSITDILGNALRSMLGHAADNSPGTVRNRLIYRFLSNLSVKRRGLTYVLEVTYSTKEPEKAAKIANAAAQQYVEDQRAAKVEITKRASSWLDDRINEMRARVRDSEDAVARYKASISSVNVTQGNPLISRQIEDLTQQLTLAHARTAEARARLDRVQQISQFRGDPSTLNEALQSNVIANLRSQYAEVARSEAEQSAVLGDRHPAIVGLRAQLSQLRAQINAEINRIQVGVRNDFQVAKSREESLQAELARLKTENSKINQQDVKLHELEREAQANRTLFEQFLSRAKETGEEQNLQLADARIVAPALAPIKPSRPSLLLLLIIATIAGSILSFGLVLLLEQFRRGLRTTAEVERFLQLPALGMMPRIELVGSSLFSGKPSDTASNAASDSARQIVFNSPASPYANSVRKIHSRVRRTTSANRETLAVISALPGEGKSTVACSLALTSAAAGVRTLLIDGDIYTTSISRTFGLEGVGLRDVLAGKATLRDATVQDADTGLHVLGAGIGRLHMPANEEIDRNRQSLFIAECHKFYDLVVIDSPAILPVAGNIPLLESIDLAVLVIEWDRTDRQAVTDALSILGTQSSKIAGAVLNKVATSWYRLFDEGRYPHHEAYASPSVVPMRRPHVDSPTLMPAHSRVSASREMTH